MISQALAKRSQSLVFIGLMGAGKSAIGRRVAERLDLEFVDADAEIEAAAGCSIEEIFDRFGEEAFRDGERRVMARLLETPMQVIATGGGAFMDEKTRSLIHEKAVCIWLKADLETLVARTSRSDDRPLLKGKDPRAVLSALIEERYPVYAEADIVIESMDRPRQETVNFVLDSIDDYLRRSA